MAKKVNVEEFMAELDHPLKPEIQSVRQIIKGVNPAITEQFKWSAPSFSYADEYLVTFNLRPTEHIHLVFHHPASPTVTSEILEGDYPDGRRMVYLRDMSEVAAKKGELERVIAELIEKTQPK